MKHEIRRVSKILDELITFCFVHGTDDLDISINKRDDHFKIHIDANTIDCSDKRVKKLKELLDIPRQSEYEEYYWELTGESDCDTELSLVGSMVDKAKVVFHGDALEITLYRYKE
ncbi:hypothetical protein [Dethiothermospora halolimnae]|uniref:hypothetical protein n=1 Tax=Dethiothermospora halolimnae TaxID=3114390 RepID=UPI003CCC2D8E